MSNKHHHRPLKMHSQLSTLDDPLSKTHGAGLKANFVALHFIKKDVRYFSLHKETPKGRLKARDSMKRHRDRRDFGAEEENIV